VRGLRWFTSRTVRGRQADARIAGPTPSSAPIRGREVEHVETPTQLAARCGGGYIARTAADACRMKLDGLRRCTRNILKKKTSIAWGRLGKCRAPGDSRRAIEPYVGLCSGNSIAPRDLCSAKTITCRGIILLAAHWCYAVASNPTHTSPSHARRRYQIVTSRSGPTNRAPHI